MDVVALGGMKIRQRFGVPSVSQSLIPVTISDEAAFLFVTTKRCRNGPWKPPAYHHLVRFWNGFNVTPKPTFPLNDERICLVVRCSPAQRTQ